MSTRSRCGCGRGRARPLGVGAKPPSDEKKRKWAPPDHGPPGHFAKKKKRRRARPRAHSHPMRATALPPPGGGCAVGPVSSGPGRLRPLGGRPCGPAGEPSTSSSATAGGCARRDSAAAPRALSPGRRGHPLAALSTASWDGTHWKIARRGCVFLRLFFSPPSRQGVRLFFFFYAMLPSVNAGKPAGRPRPRRARRRRHMLCVRAPCRALPAGPAGGGTPLSPAHTRANPIFFPPTPDPRTLVFADPTLPLSTLF